MDKKLTKSTTIWSPQNTQIYYSTNCYWQYNKTQTYVPYNCPGFKTVDNVIASLCALIRIHY